VVVLETIRHVSVLESDDAPFGNHGPFRITTSIAHGLVGTFQRRPNEDMPTFLANMPQQLVNVDASASVAAQTPAVERIGLVRFSDPPDHV